MFISDRRKRRMSYSPSREEMAAFHCLKDVWSQFRLAGQVRLSQRLFDSLYLHQTQSSLITCSDTHRQNGSKQLLFTNTILTFYFYLLLKFGWTKQNILKSVWLMITMQHHLCRTGNQSEHLTNNHQKFLLLFDDVDLKDWPKTGNLGQGVLDNIQGIQTFFRAHQYDLQQGHKSRITPVDIMNTWSVRSEYVNNPKVEYDMKVQPDGGCSTWSVRGRVQLMSSLSSPSSFSREFPNSFCGAEWHTVGQRSAEPWPQGKCKE